MNFNGRKFATAVTNDLTNIKPDNNMKQLIFNSYKYHEDTFDVLSEIFSKTNEIKEEKISLLNNKEKEIEQLQLDLVNLDKNIQNIIEIINNVYAIAQKQYKEAPLELHDQIKLKLENLLESDELIKEEYEAKSLNAIIAKIKEEEIKIYKSRIESESESQMIESDDLQSKSESESQMIGDIQSGSES